MKKFLAIVMCLAMALSMMTVVSFAADLTIGADSITAAPGEVVSIPVKANMDIDLGLAQIDVNVPDGITFDVTPGTFPTGDINIMGQLVRVYNDAGATLTSGATLFTINVTAPAEAGDYEFTFGEESMFFDLEYLDIPATYNNFTLTVEEAVVEPEVEAVEVPVDPTEEGGVVTVMTVKGAPATFGVEYAGVKYPSAATAEDLGKYDYFAVELIGVEDASSITTYFE